MNKFVLRRNFKMKRFGALRRNNERGFQTLGIVEKRDQKSDLSGFQ